MAQCKDCIHHAACLMWEDVFGSPMLPRENADACEQFLDVSLWSIYEIKNKITMQ